MAALSHVQAIAFDAYGTLFNVSEATWAKPEVVQTARLKQLQYSWLASLMGDYKDFREITLLSIEYALQQHAVKDANVDEMMQAQVKLKTYPEVDGALQRMGRRRPLAIFSNGLPESLEAVATNAGIRGHFEHIISAHEVRIFKPAPQTYQLAVDRVGVPRERLLFVSGNGWDVAGAAHFGLPVAWINRTHMPPERVGGKPEIVVDDLAQLADLLA